jgi:hypothetical protein
MATPALTGVLVLDAVSRYRVCVLAPRQSCWWSAD